MEFDQKRKAISSYQQAASTGSIGAIDDHRRDASEAGIGYLRVPSEQKQEQKQKQL